MSSNKRLFPEMFDKHLVLKKIPKNIYRELSNGCLSSKDLELLECPLERALKKVKRIQSKQEQFHRLLLIYFCHENFSFNIWKNFFQELISDPVFLIKFTFAVGDMELFDVLSPYFNEEIILQTLDEGGARILLCASENGNLDAINHLCKLLPDDINQMIEAENYFAFIAAAENGHLDVFNLLCELVPEQVMQMIEHEAYEVFREAAANGQLSVINRLCELAPEQVMQMIEARKYEAFELAASNGHWNVINRLHELAPGKEIEMVEAQCDIITIRAIANGHLDIVNYLCELLPDKVNEMIGGFDYYAFQLAAENGHLSIINRFCELAPDEVRAMFASDNYSAFRMAASKGHLNIINRLCELAPELIQEMIQAGNYDAFQKAAANGHINILKQLCKLKPELLLEMIMAKDYGAFRKAAASGQLKAIQLLCKLAPNKINQMVESKEFDAFGQAAAGGHLDMLNLLRNLSPGLTYQMVEAGNYSAFQKASKNGYLDIINFLCQILPDKVVYMVQADNFNAFQKTSENGHIDTVNLFFELVPDDIEEMVGANDFYAFRKALFNSYFDVVNKLLEQPSQFNFAEMHDAEYGERCIYSFINSKLAALRATKETYEFQNPNGVFDVTDNDSCQLLFYMIRNLIRRRDVDLLDDIRFLISIPSVRGLVHTEIAPNRPNELLRLALNIDNEPACELLLTIPAVRELAEENNYYLAEQSGDIDLRALAQDRESSMHALTSAEAQRLENINNHYRSFIENVGIINIFDDLKLTLKSRYNLNPALIETDNRKITLPFDWLSFDAMELTPSERVAAFKVYHQHKDHTAYRYLSKPNPWISDQAGFVCINEARNERWSTFEEYIPLITLLWVAAKDEIIGTIDGYSLKSRINHFIDELTQIGRAHNWDKSRDVIYPDGRKGVEEYDDLEGDKPSCYSGVKRRLFQSLVGHPEFRLFSEDLLEQELHQTIRAHYESLITVDNVKEIKAAVDAVIIDGDCLTKEQQALLSGLDVSGDAIHQFIEDMQFKYESSIHIAKLKQWTSEKFNCMGSVTCHLFKFYNEISVQMIVDKTMNQLGLKEQLSDGDRYSGVGNNRSSFFSRVSHDNGDEMDIDFHYCLEKK